MYVRSSAKFDSALAFIRKKGPDQRNRSSVLKRKSARVWLFWRRISPLILRNRVTRSPLPLGSSSLTTLFMKLSSISRSRLRNFFGKILDQKRAVVSMPAGFVAYTTGVVVTGRSHGNANREKRSPDSADLFGIGKLRNLYGPFFSPASVQNPWTVNVTSSAPPWLM